MRERRTSELLAAGEEGAGEGRRGMGVGSGGLLSSVVDSSRPAQPARPLPVRLRLASSPWQLKRLEDVLVVAGAHCSPVVRREAARRRRGGARQVGQQEHADGRRTDGVYKTKEKADVELDFENNEVGCSELLTQSAASVSF